jgi:glycosyltransferase involved in cell wall biosynthesis
LIFETDKIVILCVGRITKNKGYQILFDSIKYDLKSRNLALYFLGSQDYQTEGEQEELDRINAEIESLGLINHVFFLGFRRNTLDFLSACDLLVHPTKHEGFGLVLIEAMIMKKPIITTNVEAIPEILEGTGIVQLPFGDTTELRKKIIGFVENQNIFKNCISNGFERAKCFNLNRRVQAIIDYSSVLKS